MINPTVLFISIRFILIDNKMASSIVIIVVLCGFVSLSGNHPDNEFRGIVLGD